MIPQLITAHQYSFFITLISEMEMPDLVKLGRLVIERTEDRRPVYYVNKSKIKKILFNQYGHEVPQPKGIKCYQVHHCNTQRDRLFNADFYPRLLMIIKRRIARIKGYSIYLNGNLHAYSERLIDDILEK